MFPESFRRTAALRSYLLARRVLWACAFCLLLPCCGVSEAQDHPVAVPTGVSLPAKGGLYAVQPNGETNALTQLHATEIVSNAHAAGNFARSMVYSGPHSSVELEGLNASTHLSGKQISFLIRLSDDNPETYRNRFTLVRLRQSANRRVVSTFSQNIFGGQHKRQYDLVEVTRSDVDDPNANWMLLTPAQPLPPGEYGIVIMPKDANLFSDTVYDFNIDFEKAKAEVEPK